MGNVAAKPPREGSHWKDKENNEENRNDNTVCFESAPCGDDGAVLERIENCDEAVCAKANDCGQEDVARKNEKLSN